MRKLIRMAAVTAVLATGSLGIQAPAQARVSTGVAVASGLLGLGVGAAIASDHRRDDYYAPPPPPPPPVPVAYYAPPPPPPPPPSYSYDYVQHCRVFDSWNPYEGHYVRTRRCY